MKKFCVPPAVAVALLAALPVPAQETTQAAVQLTIEPTEITLPLGQKVTLAATVKDAEGNEIDRPVLFFSLRKRIRAVEVGLGARFVFADPPPENHAQGRRQRYGVLLLRVVVRCLDPLLL